MNNILLLFLNIGFSLGQAAAHREHADTLEAINGKVLSMTKDLELQLECIQQQLSIEDAAAGSRNGRKHRGNSAGNARDVC
jgi:hypothetical protein